MAHQYHGGRAGLGVPATDATSTARYVMSGKRFKLYFQHTETMHKLYWNIPGCGSRFSGIMEDELDLAYASFVDCAIRYVREGVQASLPTREEDA